MKNYKQKIIAWILSIALVVTMFSVPITANAASVSVALKSLGTVTDTTARINATVTKSSSIKSGMRVGAEIWDGMGYACSESEEPSEGAYNKNNGTNFNVWYDLSGLTKGTVYKYQFYATYNKVTYESKEGSFTTSGSYTVSFNTQGGSSVSNKTGLIRGKTYGTLPTPTKTGYAFTGWYTSATGGTKVTSSSTFTATANQTLYAHWSKDVYYVDFWLSDSAKSIVGVEYGEKLGELAEPYAKEGHDFVGWFDANGKQYTENSIITGDVDLYPKYKIQVKYVYCVDYPTEGNKSMQPVNYGETPIMPVLTKTNYTFKGWYTEDGTKITNSTVIKKDITVYPKWERNSKLKKTTLTVKRNTTTGQPALTWTAVSDASSYKVWRREGLTGLWILQKTTTAKSYKDTKAIAGKTYYYKVEAVCKLDSKANSVSAVKNCKCILVKPTVTISNATKGKLKLTWKKVTGATTYEVYRATSKYGKYTLKKTTSNQSYTNSSLTKGKTYYYKVRAVRKNGTKKVTSAYSAIKSAKVK